MKMDRELARQWAVVLATALALVVNALSNALPFNGQTTGEISDRFADYFTPAGYVFAIWGVIYVGWIAFVIFHSRIEHRVYDRLRRISGLYVLSCLLNAAWLLFWHYNRFVLSLIDMLALLVTLIAIYLLLNIGAVYPRTLEMWSVDIPFSVYLGWISVATLANLTDVLTLHGVVDGAAAVPWALAMLLAATALGALAMLIRTDWAFLLVLAWSFAGIAVNEAGTPVVAITAWVAAALALGMAGFSIYWRRTHIGVLEREMAKPSE